jgi:hypothetical protein
VIARVRRLFGLVSALPPALRLVLFVVAVLHTVGIGWGLPASDTWDNDGVAPRDFLPGLAATYTPGDFYTYPPLHLALLAVLTLPITLVAAARAGSTRIPDVLQEIIQPPYMTAMALTARIVAVLMSLGIVLAVAKLTEEIAPEPQKKRAPAFAAATVGLGISFTYYAHVSNLDVPYLFWASLSALALVRAVARHEPRRLRSFAVLAALAIATKDQAYAMFLGAAPAIVLLWMLRDRDDARRILREGAIGAALALAVLLVVDGAVTNPSGFRARLAFLGGSASQDFATYVKGPAGWANVIVDTGKELRSHYAAPLFFGGLYLLGARDALRRREAATTTVAALVPLALALSFTLFFNLTARRVEERFTLPQVVFLGAYAGIALARLAEARALRWLVRGAIVAALGLAAFTCIELDANLLGDPRYATEAYLASHAARGDVVELHGLNVYLPRIVPGPSFERPGPTPAARRGPIPGLREIEAPYTDVMDRAPRFIVVSECWVWRYLPDLFVHTPEGRVQPPTQLADAADRDATRFYGALFGGELPYRLVHESRFTHPLFRRVSLHGSVGCPVYTFERDAAGEGAPR